MPGHCYSIVNLVKVKHKDGEGHFRLVRLRNPWGDQEWTGAWSDGSAEFPDGDAKKIADSCISAEDVMMLRQLAGGSKYATNIHDGSFWMELRDFVSHFSTVIVCRDMDSHETKGTHSHVEHALYKVIDPNWSQKRFFGQWSKDGGTMGGCANMIDAKGNPTTEYNPTFLANNSQLSFEVKEQSTAFIVTLMQNPAHENAHPLATIGFYVLKIPDNQEIRISQGHGLMPRYRFMQTEVKFQKAREVVGRFTLTPGKYVFIPCTLRAISPKFFTP